MLSTVYNLLSVLDVIRFEAASTEMNTIENETIVLNIIVSDR